MDHWIAIGGIAVVWFVIVTIPGPNFLVVTQFAMARSKRQGLLGAFGGSTGDAVWASASLLGLNAVFEHANWLYEGIRIVGGCYLVFMGIRIVWKAIRLPNKAVSGPAGSVGGVRAYRRGMMTSLSNPKTAAFFSSLFLSAFPIEAPPWVYAVTITMVFSVSIVWYGLMACFFSYSKIRTLYERAKTALDVAAVSIFTLLGFRLVFGEE